MTLQRRKSLPFKPHGQVSDAVAGRVGREGDLKVRARENGKASTLFLLMFAGIIQKKFLPDGIARNGCPGILAQGVAAVFTGIA